jgi:small GTP-binding protein
MPEKIVLKVSMVGESAVGKSSLVRRYVYNEFEDRYVPSLGAKVSKKDIQYSMAGKTFDATLNIWDIMGAPSLRDILKQAYFRGVQGILAIADVSRPVTATALKEWVGAVREVSGQVPVVILANKVDLLPDMGMAMQIVEPVANDLGRAWLPTSAKTGHNVDRAFEGLLALILTRLVADGKLKVVAS